MTSGTTCTYKTLSISRRKIIRMMTYLTYHGRYEWIAKARWFFEIFVVLFSYYILMFAFPQLLLLWTAFFILAFWLPMLFAPKVFTSIIEKTLKNLDIVRIWAFLTMIIWFLFLSVYQKFDNGRAMTFSIFGYISLLKGLILLRFPTYGHNKYKWFYSTTTSCMFLGGIVVLFAVFLSWIALMKI